MMLHRILPADCRSRRADGSNLRLSTLRRVGLSEEDLLLGALSPQEILIYLRVSPSKVKQLYTFQQVKDQDGDRLKLKMPSIGSSYSSRFFFACHSWQVARVAGCLAAKGVGRGDRAP